MSDRRPGENIKVVERPPEVVKRYARRKYLLFLAHLALGAGFLAAMMARGSEVLADRAREIAGPGAFLTTGLIYFTGFSVGYLIVTLPLTFYGGYLLEQQFGLSTQTLRRWAGRRVKKWLFSFVVAAPLVVVFYWTLRRWPQMWWLPASLVWIFVSYVLTKFAPRILIPVFYTLKPIEDERLASRLAGLAARAGIRLAGVYRMDMSRETRKANAAVVGLGSTRRVVLGDTLLAKFTRDEIAAVFAHELGHVVHRHLAKGFALTAALSVGSLYAGSLVLTRTAGMLGIEQVYDIEILPVLVAVLAGIQLFVLPFGKWYSRRRELESDEYAVRSTADPEVFISAMKKLGAMNLADVRPNKLAEIFLFSHPSISRRIRFARSLL